MRNQVTIRCWKENRQKKMMYKVLFDYFCLVQSFLIDKSIEIKFLITIVNG